MNATDPGYIIMSLSSAKYKWVRFKFPHHSLKDESQLCET